MMIWIPFTFTSLRHDVLTTPAAGDDDTKKTGGATTVGDLLNIPESLTPDMAAEFVVEYIDLRGENVIQQERWLPILQREATKQHRLTGAGKSLDVIDYGRPSRRQQMANGTAVKNQSTYADINFFLQWNSFIQDIQTSACVYTLTLAAIVGIFICRKVKKFYCIQSLN